MMSVDPPDQTTEASESPQESPQEAAPPQEGQPPQPTGEPPQPTGDQPTDAAPAAAAGEEDLKGQLDDMRRRFADLETRVSSGQLTAAPPDAELANRVKQLREDFADWPQKGYDGPQPWDLKEHGLPVPGVTRDYLPGGQPDEISPVVIAHRKPLLTSGMGGPEVAQLGEALGRLGYPNTIAQGRNHSFHFDDSVAAAVGAFAREHGVKEDPSQFPPQHDPASYVGPWLWEAILRAAGREETQAA